MIKLYIRLPLKVILSISLIICGLVCKIYAEDNILQTDYILESNSLFSDRIIIQGKFIASNGTIIDEPDSYITEYIEVNSNCKYIFSLIQNSKGFIAEYDSEYDFIIREMMSSDGILTPHKDACYIRIAVYQNPFPYNFTFSEAVTAVSEVPISKYNEGGVDLFLFMGQSNMAGRGEGEKAPDVSPLAGYEFRAISDPTGLYPIIEPFGYNENNIQGICDIVGDTLMKSGDLVPSFINAYFSHTKTTIIAVSVSQGATCIEDWMPYSQNSEKDIGELYYDAKQRMEKAVSWLESHGYIINKKYIVWCQGESDGDNNLSVTDYKARFEIIYNAWINNGIDAFFVIQIGDFNVEEESIDRNYSNIRIAQEEICRELDNAVLVSRDFQKMKELSLMKDAYHYYQEAYNEVGTVAGTNAAEYTMNN